MRVYDEQKRFAPQFDEANRQILDCDSILIAAGQAPDLAFLEEGGSDIEQFRPGWPKVDPLTLMAAFGTSSTVQGALTESEIASVITFLRTWEGKR